MLRGSMTSFMCSAMNINVVVYNVSENHLEDLDLGLLLEVMKIDMLPWMITSSDTWPSHGQTNVLPMR